ncbi:MAG TPA: PTS sugar transporter subunit IIA [Planctomycetota bacterium]|nr:PTS sugar transporter subunit IIA [Planctomycetota bacterium]
MQLESLLSSRLTVNSLQSRDAAGAFDEVARALADAGVVAAARVVEVRDAYLAREKQGSTCLGFGMAVPHVFVSGVQGVHLVVARSNEGVDLGAVDSRPVRVMFCLLSDESERTKYLAALGAVARVARDKDYRRLIERAGAAAQAVEHLLQGDKALGR